jgi:predicted nuclease of predicted toxin-antitoxin system
VRFFLDHDVPAEIARVLRNEGHDVVELRNLLSIESTDEEVFSFAAREKRLMLTCNRDDFLKLAEKLSHHGLIILIRRRSRHAECAHLLSLLDRAGETGLTENINFA